MNREVTWILVCTMKTYRIPEKDLSNLKPYTLMSKWILVINLYPNSAPYLEQVLSISLTLVSHFEQYQSNFPSSRGLYTLYLLSLGLCCLAFSLSEDKDSIYLTNVIVPIQNIKLVTINIGGSREPAISTLNAQVNPSTIISIPKPINIDTHSIFGNLSTKGQIYPDIDVVSQ